MLDKLSEIAEGVRLRAGQVLRERKERAAEAKAKKAAHQRVHGHENRFWLLSIPATATLLAAFVECYWAWLFCVEATGTLDGSWSTALASGAQPRGAWTFSFDIHNVFVLIGLVCATVPIVMWSMVWLPVQMKARGHGRWRRVTMITTGLLANALVIMSGTVVMNSNRQEQVRAAQVIEQQAGQNRAAIQAQIAAVDGDIARLTDRRINNEYAATAANVGADAYRASYMTPEALARSPVERRDIIVRALGAAQRADTLRTQRLQLIGQLAAAPTAAAVAPNVRDDVGVGLNTFAQYATVYRPPFVALICTLIGIYGTWWLVGLLEAMDRHSVSLSGWADEGHRIEDLRAEEEIAAEPMKPHREVVTDAETGEELIKVTPKPHWRKRKGQKQKVEFTPEVPPDESGVEVDGGGRIATSAAAESVNDSVIPIERKADDRPNDPAVNEDAKSQGYGDGAENSGDSSESAEQHSSPPISDEEAAAALFPELADGDQGLVQDAEVHAADETALPTVSTETSDDASHAEDGNAAVEPQHDEILDQGIASVFGEAAAFTNGADRQPETDPRRLLAAE